MWQLRRPQHASYARAVPRPRTRRRPPRLAEALQAGERDLPTQTGLADAGLAIKQYNRARPVRSLAGSI
jgi:hypothetical protein